MLHVSWGFIEFQSLKDHELQEELHLHICKICKCQLLTCLHSQISCSCILREAKVIKKKICLPPGANPSLPGRLDGPLDVGPRHGSRQLLHPLSDCPRWPAGDWLPRPLLPHALVHRRQRHKHGQLNAYAVAHRKKNSHILYARTHGQWRISPVCLNSIWKWTSSTLKGLISRRALIEGVVHLQGSLIFRISGHRCTPAAAQNLDSICVPP